MKKDEPIPLNFQISSVTFPTNASCDCVVEAMVSLAPDVANVVVPTPSAPTKNEFDVDVDISDPTVSCEVVAIKLAPVESETMIEFAGYDD